MSSDERFQDIASRYGVADQLARRLAMRTVQDEPANPPVIGTGLAERCAIRRHRRRPAMGMEAK